MSDTELMNQARALRAQLTAPGAPFELVTVEHNGQQLPAYRNAFPTLPALINAGREHAGKEFMVYEGDRWSYERFFAAVDALAGRLQQQHGLKTGDRVAIAMRNRPEWAVAFAAVALVGAIPAPINSFGLHNELLANLQDLKPTWFIGDKDRFDRIGADLPALGCRALVVDAALGDASWSDLIAPGAPAFQTPELTALSPAVILFTSGATSHAKGVLSNQRAVCQALFNIDFIGAISAMLSPKAVAAIMAKGLQPTTLTAVPLFHVSGLHAQLLASMRHGRRLVFTHRWDPAQVLELIRQERITQFNGAPAMVQQLISLPAFDDPAVTGSLGGIGFGGAGLPQRLIDEVLTRKSDSMSGIGFGMTETNGTGAASSGVLFTARPNTSGLVSPIMDVRICDVDGTELPPGEAGEICMRGITVMDGYWELPDETARAIRHGWLHTGDVGYVDADGFLRVVDRIKDVINRSGEKIAAAEVESCLLQYAGLQEAAVFARPDDVTGEAVVAVVVPAPGVQLTAEAVRQHVAERLAAYKVPAEVHLRSEPMPRNPAGKLLKTQLKREYLSA